MTDGNVTLNVSVDPLVAYPVGSIYMSVNAANPSTLFGGTWEALDQGRVLIGACTAYPAGSTGGEASHTLTTNEMPSHSHNGSTNSAGSHSHTRGSMNITGRFFGNKDGSTNFGFGSSGNTSGAFYNGGNEGYKSYAGGIVSDRGSIKFDASNSWAGSTSSDGSHSHGVSIDSAGGGNAHNNMQPYLSVYMWKRTA